MKTECCRVNPDTEKRNLYESSAFSGITGGIRPGGLTLTEHLIELCGFSEGDLIADIGCGYGLTIEHLRKRYNFETAGIDLSDFLLKAGSDRVPDLRLINGRGESLPFRDSSFNGVIAECSLSVMDDPALVFNEIFRILKPGGKFVMSDVYLRQPEYAENIRKLPLKGCLSGAFIYDELVTMSTDTGFNLLVHEEHSNLWKEFVAGLILNNDCICDIFLCGCSVPGKNSIMMPEIVKARPGYFSIIAEKRYN